MQLSLYPFNYQCGGSIIQPYTVLTAAHCFYNISVDGLLLCTSWKSFPSDLNPLCIYDEDVVAIIHPNYNPDTLENDIAILITSQEIPMDVTVPKYPVLATSQPPVGQTVTVAGWGLTATEGTSSKVLRSVELEVQPGSTCLVRIYFMKFF